MVRQRPLAPLDDPQAIARANHFLARHEPAIAGRGGNDHTYKTALRLMVFGLSADAALAILDPWNALCDPPWSPDELKTIVGNAYTYGQNRPGVSSPQADFEPVKQTTSRELYFDLYESVTPDENAVPLIDGYLDAHGFAVLYGDSNTGKTFIALDMALAVATGRKFCRDQFDTEQGAVVYVAAEGGRGIRKRVAALKKHHGIAKAPLAIVPCSVNLLGRNPDTKPLIDLIGRASVAVGGKVSLVVIDTLSRAMSGGNENASEDMTAFIAAIDRIRADSDATVLVVHHTGKDAARGARGHSSLRAAVDNELEVADGVLVSMKQRDEGAAADQGFTLVVTEVGVNRKGRPVTSCAVEWLSVGGDFKTMDLVPEEAVIFEAVVRAFSKAGKPVNMDQISDELRWNGIALSRQTVERRSKILAEKGKLFRAAKGRWRPVTDQQAVARARFGERDQQDSSP